MAHRELRYSVLLLVLVATVFLVATKFANGSGPPPSLSSEGQQIGKFSVCEKFWITAILCLAIPRSTITCSILQFAFPTKRTVVSTKPQCSMRLMICFLRRTKMSSLLKGNDLTLRTPRGRKIKAHLVDEKQC